MTQKLKAQLTVLINLLLLVFFATSVFFIGNAWQQQRERETREQEQQRYFVQVEGYLQEITSFISSISNHYTGDCPRRFVLLMRKELFNIPGAIEFGVIEKDGDFRVRIDLELSKGYEFPSSFFTLATSAS